MAIGTWLLMLLCVVVETTDGVTESAQPEADVAYTYDALGRVSSEVSRGFTHQYTYDLGGNRIATTYGTGREEERVFDALNRPVSITESGRTTSYYYDLAGRAVGQLSGNGQWGTSHYDAQGRLVRRTLREGAGGTQPVLAELAFHYDAVGNLRQQEEWWPGEASRNGVRATMLAYDNGDRLRQELVNDGTVQTGTDYHYDQVGNRTLKVVRVNGAVQKQTVFSVTTSNQLATWAEYDGSWVLLREALLGHNDAGNRTSQTITPAGGSSQTTYYGWDYDNRLTSVTLPDSSVHTYGYDYRMRRVTRSEPGGNPVAMTFSGGLSVAEYEVTDPQQGALNAQPTVEYQRGPDMGGGVGGLLYSLRSGTAKFNLSNGRGDVVAQSDSTGALTWTASYEAYGKRPVETGSNADRQRANSKEEDPTGLLNEGFRYRDLETGTWLSRDPAGFVDGPNLYAYVQQNPWSKFDPDGLTLALLNVFPRLPVTTPTGAPIPVVQPPSSPSWLGRVGMGLIRANLVLTVLQIPGSTPQNKNGVHPPNHAEPGIAVPAGTGAEDQEKYLRERGSNSSALANLNNAPKAGDTPTGSGQKDQESAERIVHLVLYYGEDWTQEQKDAADKKCKALTEADTKVVHRPDREGKTRKRYEEAFGPVPRASDVDHVQDLQLNGSDSLENMLPLDSSVNRSLGAKIHHLIKDLPEGTKVGTVAIMNKPSSLR